MTHRPLREEEINLIAYGIWEKEGRPHGKDIEHYQLAEKIWEERHSLVSEPSATPRRAVAGAKPPSRMRRVVK